MEIPESRGQNPRGRNQDQDKEEKELSFRIPAPDSEL
jgi:hypothetical protein